MTLARTVPTRRALRAAVVVLASVLAAAALPAGAMTVNYQCIGYRPLEADLNPRGGHVTFEGHTWHLVRVPGANEARYVGEKGAVSVVARKRELTLVRGGSPLRCVLLSDAVQVFATKPPGPASAASPAPAPAQR